jgi:hypothetical protein
LAGQEVCEDADPRRLDKTPAVYLAIGCILPAFLLLTVNPLAQILFAHPPQPAAARQTSTGKPLIPGAVNECFLA